MRKKRVRMEMFRAEKSTEVCAYEIIVLRQERRIFEGVGQEKNTWKEISMQKKA